MKTYRIPATWQCYGYVVVEADSLQDAIDMCQDAPLPNGKYVDGSFELDVDIIATNFPDENCDLW